MKKNTFIILLCLVQNLSSGQVDTTLTNVIKENLDYYCIFNNDIYKQQNYNRGKSKYLYLNNQSIDSLGLKFTTFPYACNGKQYLYDKNKIYEIDNSKIQEFREFKFNIYNFSNLVTTVDLEDRIYTIDIFSGDTTLMIDMSKILYSGEYESEIIIDHYIINMKNIFIRTGFCIASCERYNFYIYNIEQKSLEKLDIDQAERNYIFEFNIMLSSQSKNLGYILNSDSKQKNGEWIFDSELNLISKTLSKHQIYYDAYNSDRNMYYNFPHIAGCNFQNEEIQNYFLHVTSDDEQRVIVPYKFIPQLEIAMYKAYNDTILNKEEIQDFGKYELGILRNLIFAKHNYEFNSEFYQAYFNLFAFYNHPEMRKSRTKDVNNLLTANDKKNLSLITELENKLK